MPFGNITSALADSFGLSQGTVGAIGFLTGWVITGLGAMLGLCPWWVVAAYGVFPGAFVILPLFMSVLANEGKDVMATPSYVAVSTAKQSSKNLVELTLRIEKSSQKWAEFHNNLDALLGIETIKASKWDGRGGGMEVSTEGLYLSPDRKLLINQFLDWYIADKLPGQDVFKIIGLLGDDSSRSLVYLLGKNKETGQPFLTSISSAHLEDSIEKCMDAKKENETNGLMVGLMMSAIGRAMLPTLMKGIVDGADTKGVKR
jgi:hypothetical protein